MIKYEDLLVLDHLGTTEWLNEKEMYIPKDMLDGVSGVITAEIVDGKTFILRGYWENGKVRWEKTYRGGKLNGVCSERDRLGRFWWRAVWDNGKLIKKIK